MTRRQVPILTHIRSKDIAEFGEPLKHKDEEFISLAANEAESTAQ